MALQVLTLGAKKWRPWRHAGCNIADDSDEQHSERDNEKLAPEQPLEEARNPRDSANQDPVSRKDVETSVASLNGATDGRVTPASDIPRPPQFRNGEYGPYPNMRPRRDERQDCNSPPQAPSSSVYGVYSPYDEPLRPRSHPTTPYPEGRRDPSPITSGFYEPNDGAVVTTTVPNDRPQVASRLRGRRQTQRNAQRPCDLHRIYSRYGVPLNQQAGPSGSRPARHDHPGARSNPNIADPNARPSQASYGLDDGIPSPYEARDTSYIHRPLIHPSVRQLHPSPDQSSRSSSSSGLRRSNAVRYPVVVELHADDLPPHMLGARARRTLYRDRLGDTAVAETDSDGRLLMRGTTTFQVRDGSQERQERFLMRVTTHPLSDGPRAIIARVDMRPAEEEDRMSWEVVLDRAVQRSWQPEAHDDGSSSLYLEDREWHDEKLSWEDEEDLAELQASQQPSREVQGNRSSIPPLDVAVHDQQTSWGDELRRAELELMAEMQMDGQDSGPQAGEKVRDDSSSVYSQGSEGDEQQSRKKDEDVDSLYARDLDPLERPGEPDPEDGDDQQPRKWKGKGKAVEAEQEEGEEQQPKRWKGKEKAVEPEEATQHPVSQPFPWPVGDYRALIDPSPSVPHSAGRRAAFSLQGGQGPSATRLEPAELPLPQLIGGFRASIASSEGLVDMNFPDLEWVRVYYNPGGGRGAEQEEHDYGEGSSGRRNSMFH